MRNITAMKLFGATAQVAALTIALSLGAATSALAASSLLDQGYVNDGLIGQTVYKWEPSGPNDPVVVLAVDPAQSQVFVRWTDGSKGWTPAAGLYTREQSELANHQWNDGLGVVFRLGLAVMSGDGGDAPTD